MAFYFTDEREIRRRAYELYEQRTRERNALDDWLQAEAEVRLRGRDTAEKSTGESAWRNIEPLLKWAAVAYGFGFIVVMWHTKKLGIPVLQLVEPVNVWIGLPLAAVLFFLDKIGASVKRATRALIEEAHHAGLMREEMKNWSDPKRMYEAIIDAFDKIPFFFGSRSLWFPKRARDYLRHGVEQVFNQAVTPKQKRDVMLRLWSYSLYLLRVSVAGQVFLNVIAGVLIVFAACAVYVTDVYPRLPQTVGGGKPMNVNLIVNTEKIPVGIEYVRDIFPVDGSAGQQDTKESKSRATIPVILHYQTEQAYYVSEGNGPIISLDHKAVDGIIFIKAAGR